MQVSRRAHDCPNVEWDLSRRQMHVWISHPNQRSQIPNHIYPKRPSQRLAVEPHSARLPECRMGFIPTPNARLVLASLSAIQNLKSQIPSPLHTATNSIRRIIDTQAVLVEQLLRLTAFAKTIIDGNVLLRDRMIAGHKLSDCIT